MLDVDLARFLCACGLEPTAEAMVVARRLHDVGHLVVEVTEGGHPALYRSGSKDTKTAAEYLAAARMERDREDAERERWRAKIAAWDEGRAKREGRA